MRKSLVVLAIGAISLAIVFLVVLFMSWEQRLAVQRAGLAAQREELELRRRQFDQEKPDRDYQLARGKRSTQLLRLATLYMKAAMAKGRPPAAPDDLREFALTEPDKSLPRGPAGIAVRWGTPLPVPGGNDAAKLLGWEKAPDERGNRLAVEVMGGVICLPDAEMRRRLDAEG